MPLALAALLTLLLAGVASRVHAEEPTSGVTAAIESPAPEQPSASGRPQIVAAPIPLSDPALGSGLVGVASVLYEPAGTGGTWTTGLAALYTSNGSWGVAVLQKGHFRNDQFRFTAAAGYADVNVRFYGVGGALAARDISIGINQSGVGVLLVGMVRVAPHAYLGAEYVLIDMATTIDPGPNPVIPIPPTAQLTAVTSAIGLAGEYDTRDSEYGPRSGVYATGSWRYATPTLGSKFAYSRIEVAANAYFPVTSSTVIATRVNLCHASEGAPFYDICAYGSGNSLRGYANGQFRDNAMASAQVEVRQHLFWRVGAVAFAGIGGTFPGADRLGETHVLPAGGIGLRFLASAPYRVNLSIDFAVGRDSTGLYIYVGEAF